MGRTARPVDVECWPLRDVFAQYGVPHYLKLSLHGEEHFCLTDVDHDVAPRYISLELPRNLTDSEQVFSRLMALGYDAAKIIDQTNQKQFIASGRTMVSRLRNAIQRYPRIQAAVGAGRRLLGDGGAAQVAAVQGMVRGAAGSQWEFPEGSSGPFAEETDGDWRATTDHMDGLEEIPDGANQSRGR